MIFCFVVWLIHVFPFLRWATGSVRDWFFFSTMVISSILHRAIHSSRGVRNCQVSPTGSYNGLVLLQSFHGVQVPAASSAFVQWPGHFVSKLVWCVENKISFCQNPPVVILLRLAAKTANTFISKMRNDGATKIVERTETVLEAVEESVSDSFN